MKLLAYRMLAFTVIALAISCPGRLAANELTDAEVKEILIRQSIAAYSSSCPCPYSTMRNGRKCGGNSAYAKPGGAAPLCYANDITHDMVQRYRRVHSP